MFDVIRSLALIAATLTTGLVAGLYYTFFFSAMPGLARSDDRTFVTAMQQINRAILNGWFLICFAGAPVLTALALALHLGSDGHPALPWIVAGFVLQGTGYVTTFAINVPLNNALDKAGDPDQIDLAAVRARFESKWVRWNNIRAVLSMAGFACLAWALVLNGGID